MVFCFEIAKGINVFRSVTDSVGFSIYSRIEPFHFNGSITFCMVKMKQAYSGAEHLDICSIYDAIHTRGAEHRNIDTYLFVVLRCAAPYQLLSTFFTTNILRLCRFLIANDPTAN